MTKQAFLKVIHKCLSPDPRLGAHCPWQVRHVPPHQGLQWGAGGAGAGVEACDRNGMFIGQVKKGFDENIETIFLF